MTAEQRSQWNGDEWKTATVELRYELLSYFFRWVLWYSSLGGYETTKSFLEALRQDTTMTDDNKTVISLLIFRAISRTEKNVLKWLDTKLIFIYFFNFFSSPKHSANKRRSTTREMTAIKNIQLHSEILCLSSCPSCVSSSCRYHRESNISLFDKKLNNHFVMWYRLWDSLILPPSVLATLFFFVCKIRV